MKYCNNTFSHYVLFNQREGFCLEAYFANSSYKVVRASFRRKLQCRHAPSKSRILTGFRSLESVGLQNLNAKGLRDTYSGGRTVSTIGRKETLMLYEIRSA